MTKARAALTPFRALTSIAGVIGWEACAAIVGKAERTIRNWSDPDTTQAVTFEAMVELDSAYLAACPGEGPPLFLALQAQLQLRTAEAEESRRTSADLAAKVAKESGEAIAAQIDALRPNATVADHLVAIKETDEAVEALIRKRHDLVARARAGGAAL